MPQPVITFSQVPNPCLSGMGDCIAYEVIGRRKPLNLDKVVIKYLSLIT